MLIQKLKYLLASQPNKWRRINTQWSLRKIITSLILSSTIFVIYIIARNIDIVILIPISIIQGVTLAQYFIDRQSRD